MTGGGNIAKFILTVEVGDEQADDVHETLLEMAGLLNAGLTRGDFEPTDQTDGNGGRYYRKVRHKRHRKLGRLA